MGKEDLPDDSDLLKHSTELSLSFKMMTLKNSSHSDDNVNVFIPRPFNLPLGQDSQLENWPVSFFPVQKSFAKMAAHL